MVLDSNAHKLKVHLKSGKLHLHQQLTVFFVYFVVNVHYSSEKVTKITVMYRNCKLALN